MTPETVFVPQQPFYRGEVYEDAEFDFTVVPDARVLDSTLESVESAVRTVGRCVAAIAVATVLTVHGFQLHPSGLTSPPTTEEASVTEAPIGRQAALTALAARLRARASVVEKAFVRVPLSAAERDDDPDYGF